MLRSTFRPAALVGLIALLAACGGGGGGGGTIQTPTQPAPPVSAEGEFDGSLQGSTTASAFNLLTLDTGQYWALYGNTNSAGALLVSGFVEGTGSMSGNTFTSGDLRDFGVAPAAPGTLTATVAANSITGTAVGASRVTFSGSRPQQAHYVYDTPADPAQIAGLWNATTLDGTPTQLAVSSSGALVGNSGGCTFSGSLTPHGQKNVFDAVVTFGGPPCVLPGQTATGIALDFRLSTGQQELIAAAVNQDRTLGTVLFGQR